MSLHPQAIGPIPEETVRVARAAFPKGNLYMQIRDAFGSLYEDRDFLALFPARGQPAEAPWRLALTTIMQFVEGLSDRQTAEAVRARIDWKYALGLTLTDPGFDFSILCEFRARLLNGQAEQLLLGKLLERLQAEGLLKARGKQRSDSTHVLAAIRTLNRLELVGETLRAALNSVAVVAPGWLRDQVQADWFDRYGRRVEEYRFPKEKQARQVYATTMGNDGLQLLAAIDAEQTMPWLGEMSAVQVLRQVWAQHFEIANGVAQLKEVLPPAAQLVNSPYETEARYGHKRTTIWRGYKVHLTETCDPDSAHIITHVETTSGTVADVEMTDTIHQALVDKGLPPGQHIVDAGYVEAELLLKSQKDYGVSLIGPMRPDNSWQAQAEQGFDISKFVVNWKAKKVTCPQGRVTRKWCPSDDGRGHKIINVRFAQKDCIACPSRSLCTRAANAPRELTLRTQEAHELIQATRQRRHTAQWDIC